MRLLDLRALPGPNAYTRRPALVALLDLEGLAGRDTSQRPGLADRLLAAGPGLADHHCGLGRPGGFVERLREGTFYGHVVEHVALELQTAAGCEVRHGKTRETRTPGVYRLVVEYTNEPAARFLLETARELVEAVYEGRPFPVADRLAEARRIVARTSLGPSTKAIADAAERQLPALAPDVRAVLGAYAAGVNAGLTVGLTRKPHEYAILGGKPGGGGRRCRPHQAANPAHDRELGRGVGPADDPPGRRAGGGRRPRPGAGQQRPAHRPAGGRPGSARRGRGRPADRRPAGVPSAGPGPGGAR